MVRIDASRVHHGRTDWLPPGGPELAVSIGQLVSQLGDFAAEVLVRRCAASSRRTRDAAKVRCRVGTGTPATGLLVAKPLDGGADLGLGVEPGAADAAAAAMLV